MFQKERQRRCYYWFQESVRGRSEESKFQLMSGIEQTARLLAREHSAEDTGIEAIYWAPSDDEVHLVEVSTSVPDRGEALPFRFASDSPEVPYPSVVILLSPGDWTRIESRQLELPSSFQPLQSMFSR